MLQAVTQKGEGDATPNDGDLVSVLVNTTSNWLVDALTPRCTMSACVPTATCVCGALQVYVHFSVLNIDGDLLYTTWAEQGGSGQPLAFVLGKGCRAPRAWELAILGR